MKTWKLPEFGVLSYQALCLAAALAVFLLRSPHTHYLVNLLMLTIGVGAIASIMRIGPILYLGVVTFSILLQGAFDQGWDDAGSTQASDILLSLAVLAFVAGHYRLQSLTHSILPVDRRRSTAVDGRWKIDRPVRSARLVTPNEIVTLLLTLPIWALAAQLAWLWLGREWEMPGIPGDLGRLLVVLWLFGMGLLLTATVFAHWRRRQYDVVAADMLLQDVLWRETRREQRSINRWYSYGWIRGGEQVRERRLWKKAGGP